jgi:uncharacterized protein YchJ
MKYSPQDNFLRLKSLLFSEPFSHLVVFSTVRSTHGGVPCDPTTSKTSHFFEPMSKRRRSFPSETHVRRGMRIVHGDKELTEKLGRNDLCPCGSGKRFKKCCLQGSRF